MADKWEVVGGGKKKKPVANGQQAKPAVASSANLSPVSSKSNGKAVRNRKKVDMDFKVRNKEVFQVPQKTDSSYGAPKKAQASAKPKKKTTKQVGGKTSSLETAIEKVSASELGSFYQELQTAGYGDDVARSWLKYCADTLNLKIGRVTAADSPHFPNDLEFPSIPSDLEETIQKIINETASQNENSDVLDASFASLLASLPNLANRGDAGWGYLVFLRELVTIDPDVILRKSRTYNELMESYGNKKEVGVSMIWTAVHACIHSKNSLTIFMRHIAPYYSFKHYKPFIVSALGSLAAGEDMTVNADAEEFVEFFDMAMDPKRKREFEKYYESVKGPFFRNLSGTGAELFELLLPRLGKSDFMPLSVVGQETQSLLASCISHDSIDVLTHWQDLVLRHPRESGVLLNYLVKNIERLENGKALELHFLKSENFANAATKHPELGRYSRKFQENLKRVESSRKKSRWWPYLMLLLCMAIGLVVYDVNENGKGLFSKSKSGKFLQQYGLLDDALFIGEQTRTYALHIGERSKSYATAVSEYCAPHLRVVYERVQPVLQAIDKQLQVYLPKVVEVFQLISEKVVLLGNYIANEVFVGELSPENLRKHAIAILDLVREYLNVFSAKVLELTEQLVKQVKTYM